MKRCFDRDDDPLIHHFQRGGNDALPMISLIAFVASSTDSNTPSIVR